MGVSDPVLTTPAPGLLPATGLVLPAGAAGRCLLGIFHDEEVRDAVASRVLALRPAQAAVELE